jgi:hypothetical protein
VDRITHLVTTTSDYKEIDQQSIDRHVLEENNQMGSEMEGDPHITNNNQSATHRLFPQKTFQSHRMKMLYIHLNAIATLPILYVFVSLSNSGTSHHSQSSSL